MLNIIDVMLNMENYYLKNFMMLKNRWKFYK